MTLLAFVVVCAVVLAASRGFAWGAAGDVLGLRFGADGDRTRVVIDLDRTASGRVIEDGSTGRLILALNGVAAGQGVPLVGVSYDPKVMAFLRCVDATCIELDALSAENLCAAVDAAAGTDHAALSASVDHLRSLERANTETAARLLGY